MKFASEPDVADLLARIDDDRIAEGVEAVYRDVATELAGLNVSCKACGTCCRFARFGHCLFVTSPELVCFARQWRSLPAESAAELVARLASSTLDPGEACPLQSAEACPVRAIRPLGCRIFYCDKPLAARLNAFYERMQQRMKDLCAATGLPYRYLEWTSSLRCLCSLGALPTPAGPGGPRPTSLG